MQIKDFDYSSIEVLCSDLKIIFITDEKSTETGQTDIHMHSFWELFYLQEGNLTISSEQKEYELSENQMIIIPPNSYHSSQFSSNAAKKSVFFTFEKVKSRDQEKIFENIYTAFSRCGFYKLDDTGYFAVLLNTIFENTVADKFAKKWRMNANVTELMFSLYDRISNNSYIQLDSIPKQNTYWVYKYAIDRLLDIYYINDISLELLSEKLFLSPQNITRIISTAYGKSFNELKFELKMRNAKKMLLETNLSVSEIGKKIGYTTSRGFLSAFLKYEGCTPSEYRKK